MLGLDRVERRLGMNYFGCFRLDAERLRWTVDRFTVFFRLRVVFRSTRSGSFTLPVSRFHSSKVRRDLALHQQFRELTPLGLALEGHVALSGCGGFAASYGSSALGP